jgi:pimeloyl-ACP methyl ester carboxylesterase
MHLVVLIHGLNGSEHDFDNMCAELSPPPPSPPHQYALLSCSSNNRSTLDGIEKGAVRLWREILEFEKTSTVRLTHCSFVGHSLGGLYARYVIQLLADCDFFSRVIPVVFATFATPHLGVRRPQTGMFAIAFQGFIRLSGETVSRTAAELCLEDPEPRLLHRMASEPFTRALGLFSRRLVYANVQSDFQVLHATASILPRSPYGGRTKTSTKTSTRFPSLVQWSLDNCKRSVPAESADDFALSDPRRAELADMLSKLNALSWERYDTVFATLFAHEQIISKRAFMAGRDVLVHFKGELDKSMVGLQSLL